MAASTPRRRVSWPRRIVTDYLKLRDHTDQLNEVVMIAIRRTDVAQLNTTARERLIAAGLLGDHGVIVGTGDSWREYRAGVPCRPGRPA
jgi:hypothetical protein